MIICRWSLIGFEKVFYMKKLLLVLLLPVVCQAQKQGNVWYFGIKCGLDFSSGVPVPITGGQTGVIGAANLFQESTASISDSAGKLLFYTGSGSLLWNRNHKIMPNGSNILGHRSSFQSSIIVPKPGSNSLFYVFTSDAVENYETPRTPFGYNYSLVDMCLDNKLGNVVSGQKNIHLTDSGTEKLSACSDGQEGYWIMGHKANSDAFIAWHLTRSGIVDSVTTRIGQKTRMDLQNITGMTGHLKFNATGTKLASAIMHGPGSWLELYDFNKGTGTLSNVCRIIIDSLDADPNIYNLEFSPDGSKLYTPINTNASGARLYQYDLTAGGGSCASIKASRSLIFKAPGAWGGMQAGPDGKIYIVGYFRNINRICRINNPNLNASAVNFDTAALAAPVSPCKDMATFPSFVAGFKYHNSLPCTTIVTAVKEPEAVTMSFSPNPVTGTAILSINANADIQAMEVLITDALGREIRRMAITKHTFPIDLNDHAPGLYFYQVRQEGKLIKHEKLVLQ